MKSKYKAFYLLGWTIGAFLLVYFSNLLLDYTDHKTNQTYDLTYNVWASVTIPFVMGMYLGLINGIPRRFKVNISMMIIFVPTFLVMIYLILPIYFEMHVFDFYLDLTKHNGYNYIGIISGMTLIMGLFEFKQRRGE